MREIQSSQPDLFRGARVVRVELPVIVRAAWVAGDRLFLVDSRLSDEDARAAIVQTARAALHAERDRVAKARRARFDAGLLAQVQATAAGMLGVAEARKSATASGLPWQWGAA